MRASRALVASMIIMAMPISAASAASQESQWFGSEASSKPVEVDTSLQSANIALIRDCLNEHLTGNKATCIGITKTYCDAEQPLCNKQEAVAWDALATQKRPALKKSLASWQRGVEQRCAYSTQHSGYAGVLPNDPWADKLAPSGCVLQQSAHRYLGLRTKHAK